MPEDNIQYVDGFVLVVPKANLELYREMAEMACEVWMKHGALEYKECIGDDLTPKEVEFPFPTAFKVQSDEVLVFAYIVYESRKHRDEVNAKVRKDPLMNDPQYNDMPMPFDMKRMAFGGFKVMVSA